MIDRLCSPRFRAVAAAVATTATDCVHLLIGRVVHDLAPWLAEASTFEISWDHVRSDRFCLRVLPNAAATGACLPFNFAPPQCALHSLL